jgi:DUF1365 family protein
VTAVTARAAASTRGHTRPLARDAALYECSVFHVRRTPLRNAFRYRTYQWLVDLDALPRAGGWTGLLAGFRAEDHLSGPGTTIRARVDDFLRARGIETGGGPVLMLAHARVLGYVFNPLSVFWCYRADGTLAGVIAEVHNTYHQRHAYLVQTDERGRAQTDKAFYVSPFHPVDGWYQMSLPRPGERLALSITLHRPGGYRFVASVRGSAVPATSAALLRAAVRHPWSTAMVSARIRWQGSKLYVRGLRVLPRPAHVSHGGIQ